MGTASILFKCLPFFAMVGYGVYSLLEVAFPSLRDQDFNHWEIDEDSHDYVQILGWRKMLKPPRVIAQGYLSDNAACALSLILGIVLIVGGLMGVHQIITR